VITIIEGAFEQHKEEQPIVRSIIGCLEVLLKNQDGATWSMPMIKKAYQQLLILSANASPKVNIVYIREEEKKLIILLLGTQESPGCCSWHLVASSSTHRCSSCS
jgi:hypothetical protein